MVHSTLLLVLVITLVACLKETNVAGNMSVLVGHDGRVLLYNADTYNTSTVCAYNWNDQDATVVCKQNVMGDIGKATHINRDYNFSRSMFNVYCTGNETDLSECTYDNSDSMGMCDYEQDAGVHCIDTDQTQLVLGPDGRILFYNTQTGDTSTVCSYMWTNQGAGVVCRQLGLGDSGTAFYLPRDHNYTRNMYSLECMGSETSVYDCHYQLTDYYGSCDYTSDAGVECVSQVAGNTSVLVGHDGRVLLYNAGTYNTSTVCAYNWNDQDATVVCKQTGMGDIGKATHINRDYNFSRSMFNVYCKGNETDLSECTYDTSDSMGICDSEQDAGVHCIDTDLTQMVLGPDGRILFYNILTGNISTLCSNMWNNQGAGVVCRQLGMGDSGTAVYLPRDHNYTRNMYSLECMGSETSIYDCHYQLTDYYYGSCEYVSDAGVECAPQVAGNVSVIVGHDGRVLLYNAETYNTSTVCAYNWNDQDATVVCKQIGMGDIGKATHINRDYNFSRSMFNVYCTGNETDLSECTYDNSDSMGMCDYEQDAGVHCTDTDQTQLMLGPDGRILFYNTQTGDTSTVCSYMWTNQGAGVVCRQLGLGDSGTAFYLPRDHNYTRNMYSLECMGSETSVYDCHYQLTDYYGSCDYTSDAGVECDSQVAGNTSVLVGHDGRVLLYNSGTYNTSTVCAYNWNDQDATVVCKQTGMGDIGKATHINRDYNFSRSMFNVYCKGNETDLSECTYDTSDSMGICDSEQDAGVHCIDTDLTQMVLGPDGRILFYNILTGNISTLCSNMWNNQGAGVVCRQLGMGDSGTAVYLPRDHNYTRNMYSLECMGSETSIYDCHYQLTDYYYGSCEYVSDAGVECAPQVAGNVSVIVGHDGRVLLYNAETYNTSTVCAYNWNDQDATVVCKQNGMGDIGKATHINRDYNFSRSMFNVYCTGNETDLSECTYDNSDSMGICDYEQDAGVHCTDTDQTQLVLGPDGRILFYNTQTGDTSTVCSYMWTNQGAGVVCRQLGLGDSGTAFYLPRDHNYTRNMYSLECMGSETSVYDCHYQLTDYYGSCDYTSDAGVECDSQVAGNTSVLVGHDGRVLLYKAGTFNTSTVCAYNWNDQDATVVCKQTGMGDIGKATHINRDYNFSRSMFNVYCTGNETDLSECTYDTSDSMGICDSEQDAGVHCIDTDLTQMVLGPDGRILFYNILTGNISTLCSNMWNNQGAGVVCRQLGMGDSGTAVYLPRDHNYTRNMYSLECMGSETSIYDCHYQLTDYYYGSCEYVSDAGVECAPQVAGNVSVIVGHDGRVLLYNAETYNTSTVCAYNWNDQDATVVCKQNGMGDIGKATHINRDYNFSRSMFNVYCTGNETDLSECTYDNSDSMGMCDYEQDAGVHCTDTDQTQLVLGPDGRILFYNTQTGDTSTVCSYMWTNQGAGVVCRQLGLGDSGTAFYLPRDHNYTRNMYSLECMGSETSVYDCHYQLTDYYGSCDYTSDAGVECDSQVAGNTSVLVGHDGRVLLYKAGTYNTSTVCAYNWNDQDATVVCKQTGMGDIGKATHINRDYNFSRSMFNVYCTGNETDLSECTYDTSDSMGICDSEQDAGVHCIDTDLTQMVLGPDGRILFYNILTGNISTLCSNMWNNQGAGVVCRQLGMGDSGTAVYLPRDHNYTRNMYRLECMGSETSINDCHYQLTDYYYGSCEYVSDAGVECAPQVAGNVSVIVGHDGRVLLYNAETYNTSTVCAYNWNDQDATVVCKQNGMGDIGKATHINRDYNFSRSMFNVYCTGNETDLSECTYDNSDSMGMCDYEQDAGVHCTDTDQTQLVLGPDGRILFYNTQTGDTSTVCSYMWTNQGAGVVCRQLGLGDSGTAFYLPRDHNYTRNMYSLECMGSETSVYDCHYQLTDYYGSCDYTSDAGVECDSQVAGNTSVLVGHDGRVLLYKAGTFNTSTVCAYNWNDQDATVVCKQTGMGDIGKATHINRDYNFSRSMFNVYCTGNETDLSECTYDTSDSMGICDSEQDAGVHCIDTDLTQMVLGPDGRILFYNILTGNISTLCSNMWNNQGAGVVCRQLGMGDSGTAVYLPRDHNYTRNMYSLECMGSETSIYDCHYQLTDYYYGSCEYVSDAGVECAPQVAGNVSVIVGHDGRVLLFNAETYNTSTVCAYNWNDQDATVVCKQNGMGDIGKATHINRDYNFSRSMFNVYCTGNETDLSECTYDNSDSMGMCDYEQDAGVHCTDTDQTQLVLGPDGRILFYNTQTGDTSTVCSYMWTNQGAGVVCRQLGLGDSGTAFYLPRDHNYTRNMYSLECMGSETSVYDCHYQLTDYYGSCDYTSDAGVECDSQVAGNTSVLVGHDGRVLLYKAGTYNTSTVCAYNWNDQDATVVCKQTGMGDIGKATHINRDYNFSRSMFNVYCTGNETDLSECTYDTSDSMGICDSEQDAGVHCIDTDLTQMVLGPDGRILFYNILTGNISTLCSNMWNNQGAGVVCRQLGMGDSGTAVYLPRDHNYTRNMYSLECMGSETSIYDCHYQLTDYYYGSCEYVSDAGVECAPQVAGNVSVIVGYDGRVLLYNAETYNTSTVCAYNWNDQDATVVCKQNGMGDIGKATHINRDYNFSRSMFNVYCTGNETDLSECTYDNSDSMGMCDYEQDAGVHCTDTDQTQLVLGPDGRILFYNTQTGDTSTVCSYMWTNQGAGVVCRQLGLGDSGTAFYLPRDHNYTRNMYSLECMGSETSVYDCHYQLTDYYGSCDYTSDAGVECDSQVAGNTSVLVGHDGRVLLYNAGTYNTSTVCAYHWNDQDATVVCKQTGMGDIGKATYINRDYNFSRSMFNVYCTGNETDLSECTYDTSDSMGICDSEQDAGVHCIDTESSTSMSTANDIEGNVSTTGNTLALESTSGPSLYKSSPNDVSRVINTYETLPPEDVLFVTTDEYNSHSTSMDNLGNSPTNDLFTKTLGPNTLSTEQFTIKESTETVTDLSTSTFTDKTNSVTIIYTRPYIDESSNSHNMDTSTSSNSVILTTDKFEQNSLASKYKSETITSASINNIDSRLTMAITEKEISSTDGSRTSTEATNLLFTTEPRDNSSSSSTSTLSSRSTYSEPSRQEFVSTGFPLTRHVDQSTKNAITTDLTTREPHIAQRTTKSLMLSSISSIFSITSSTDESRTSTVPTNIHFTTEPRDDSGSSSTRILSSKSTYSEPSRSNYVSTGLPVITQDDQSTVTQIAITTDLTTGDSPNAQKTTKFDMMSNIASLSSVTSSTDESRTNTEPINIHFTTEPKDDSGSSSTDTLSITTTYSESSKSEYVSTGLPLTTKADQHTVTQSAISTDLTTADSANAQTTTKADMLSRVASSSSVSSSTSSTQSTLTSVLSTAATSVIDSSNTTTLVASSTTDASRCDINSNCFNSGCNDQKRFHSITTMVLLLLVANFASRYC
ncbi:uncharacterized protein LOC134695221 [Mytilus trossulus]|uniref:uncharacterized protein LOC134695221 n=1 Tax=Mytilus trossulus TaxID=6551 RepID=UPI0030071270